MNHKNNKGQITEVRKLRTGDKFLRFPHDKATAYVRGNYCTKSKKFNVTNLQTGEEISVCGKDNAYIGEFYFNEDNQ